MRQQPELGYFAGSQADGDEAVVHGVVVALEGKQLRRITREEADAISARRRGNNVVRLPTPSSEDQEALPRFLREPDAASDMKARLDDFDRRVAAIQGRPLPKIPEDQSAKIAALESELTDVKDRLNQLIASVAKVVGHMDGGGR